METDKTFPSDDPNVTLTIRLIMQGKVRLFIFLLQCIFVMAEEASYGFFHCICSIGMYKVCTSRTVVVSLPLVKDCHIQKTIWLQVKFKGKLQLNQKMNLNKSFGLFVTQNCYCLDQLFYLLILVIICFAFYERKGC